MSKIFEEYNSFTELYDSIIRGNEIEFQYGKKQYYILPNFEGNSVRSICFGEAYSENEVICTSENELYNVSVENTILGKAVSQSDIKWKNF